MAYVDDAINIVCDVLVMHDRKAEFDENTALLGAIPEFDSMAVVGVITAMEEEFGFTVDDDEIDADVFASIGSLAAFIEQKDS